MATQYTAGLTAGQVLTAATMNQIGAAWETWTPQFWQGANVTSTVEYSKYTRINKLVIVSAAIAITAAGTAGQQIQIRNLPVTSTAARSMGGSWVYLDSGVAWYAGSVYGETTTSAGFYAQNTGNWFGAGTTAANGDLLRFQIIYEAA